MFPLLYYFCIREHYVRCTVKFLTGSRRQKSRPSSFVGAERERGYRVRAENIVIYIYIYISEGRAKAQKAPAKIYACRCGAIAFRRRVIKSGNCHGGKLTSAFAVAFFARSTGRIRTRVRRRRAATTGKLQRRRAREEREITPCRALRGRKQFHRRQR